MIKYLIRDQRSSIRHRTCVHERCPPAVLAERVLSAEDPTSGVKGHSHCSEYVVSVSDHGCPEHRASASHQEQLRRWHVRGVANVARMLHQSAAAALSAQYMEM